MRANLASSIAVSCAAVLALPLTAATPAGATGAFPTVPGAASAARAVPPAAEPAGSTQSLPLEPLAPAADAPRDRVLGSAAAAGQGLARRDVRPFSLVGVVWDDVHASLRGSVQVRTRSTGAGIWSDWQSVETHNDEHGADPGTDEGHSRALRGSTAPLWVGDSDGVEIRVRPDAGAPGEHAGEGAEPGGYAPDGYASPDGDVPDRPDRYVPREAAPEDAARDGRAPEDAGPRRTRPVPAPLPAGLRLELVDPGPEPPATETRDRSVPGSPAARAVQPARGAHAAPAAPAAPAELPALTRAQTLATLPEAAAAAKPYIGPRPRIVTRKGWGADERLREKGFVYTKTIKAVFVHHSATGNRYTCRQAPSVLRSIYRYHVKSSGWRDFGYNFAVDKCGNIYEGRAGGVTKPVMGAHTLGFNTNSMGIAVLGTYGGTTPPAAAVTAVARLTAWKLGLYGVNPQGKTYLTSGGGNLYKKGRKVRFNAISGHRDGFATECPGARLYGKLGTARTASATYQGRR
ncbi:N-acetylmuramoyl-L-alanine amidase [Streptomyces sp. NBC_01268]|uniref:N-acetylmuramoyl-L-alanine amidase n=1 Tax=unclassified Streptomyces TaxID=2593676 RepID=UPI002E33D59B|nr:N-acetylmuramoyl-L-alanine amidase [Streptomyces sp. NBC_01268]